MKSETLRRLEEAFVRKTPIARVVRLSDGEERVSLGEGDGPFEDAVRESLRSDRALVFVSEDQRWLVHPFNPPLRLAIVGAVHIAKALADMARCTGYEVTLIDPRRAFGHPARFPSFEVSGAWPDEALLALKLDRRSAVVTLTHDPKLDDPALEVALKSPAFYVGSLGSRRTQAARLSRLEKKGFDATARARVHGPIGLPLGARTPAEIAVSILAEMTEVLRKGTSSGKPKDVASLSPPP